MDSTDAIGNFIPPLAMFKREEISVGIYRWFPKRFVTV